MPKILWDFEIQTDYTIPPRRPNLELINKKRTRQQVDFAISVDHRLKIKEVKKTDKYLE